MKLSLRQPLSAAMTFVVLTVFSMPRASGHEHIVSMTELQGKLRSVAAEREKNIDDIQRVLSYPAAEAALKKSNVNLGQVRAAVATLSDDELTRLANQARASEKDVEGGLIVGLLALIGLIVVIIVVVSIVAKADLPQPELAVSA
jgi:hypothetical protein